MPQSPWAWETSHAPFWHLTAEGLVDPPRAAAVAAEALRGLAAAPEEWVRYDNDVERRKWAQPDLSRAGPEARALFELLNDRSLVEALEGHAGVRGLRADPTLHGAGIHVVEPGGHLSPHLDYARHPKLPDMERRVNLLLFLTGGAEADGGAFELYDDECREVRARVYPRPGRAVVWCPGDVEYHGTQRVSESAGPRVAAACYYLAPARPTAVRKRALFVPNRGG